MITLITQSYFAMVLAIIGVCILCAAGIVARWAKKASAVPAMTAPSLVLPVTTLKRPLTISSHDIHAIAGDDVLMTQLDLARAYMETDRKHLAKKILQFVIAQGTSEHRLEAERLLSLI